MYCLLARALTTYFSTPGFSSSFFHEDEFDFVQSNATLGHFNGYETAQMLMGALFPSNHWSLEPSHLKSCSRIVQAVYFHEDEFDLVQSNNTLGHFNVYETEHRCWWGLFSPLITWALSRLTCRVFENFMKLLCSMEMTSPLLSCSPGSSPSFGVCLSQQYIRWVQTEPRILEKELFLPRCRFSWIEILSHTNKITRNGIMFMVFGKGMRSCISWGPLEVALPHPASLTEGLEYQNKLWKQTAREKACRSAVHKCYKFCEPNRTAAAEQCKHARKNCASNPATATAIFCPHSFQARIGLTSHRAHKD